MFLGAPRLGLQGSRVVLVVKSPPTNAEDIKDVDSIAGLGSSPGEGNGNQLQFSWLENPMDSGGAWWTTVLRVTKSQRWLKKCSNHAHRVSPYILPIIISFLLKFIPWSLCSSLLCTCNSLYFSVCFDDISIIDLALFLFPFAQNTYISYLSFTVHIIFLYVFIWSESFVGSIYIQVLFIYPFSYCLSLVEAFSPFIFNIIINIYVLITILLLFRVVL